MVAAEAEELTVWGCVERQPVFEVVDEARGDGLKRPVAERPVVGTEVDVRPRADDGDDDVDGTDLAKFSSNFGRIDCQSLP